MKKLLILVNKLADFPSTNYVQEYLQDTEVTLSESIPCNTDDYDLVLLWNYRKIVPNIGDHGNAIVFHSSALPKGKGWATIYHTIVNEEEYYTISGIKAVDEVDAGEILVRAHFKMHDNYTAKQLRDWDNRIMLMLTNELLVRGSKPYTGIPQQGEGSYFPRRYPEDSQVLLDTPFYKIINHLRACEDSHPAYFYLNDTKYYISIEPEDIPEFPQDLRIEFY